MELEAFLDAVPDEVKLAATVIGLYFVGTFALGCLWSVYAFMLRPGKNLKKYGEWAIVTGSTDGIGKAMALEFARKGLKVLLVSRTLKPKAEPDGRSLQETKAFIEEKTKGKAEVEVLQIGFSKFDEAAQAKVAKTIADKNVAVLVNNVGVSYSFCKYFDELTIGEVDNMVNLNVNSTGRMTHLVLQGMLKKKGGKKGCIVNMSSSAARSPTPLLAQYSGTKGYIELLTQSLASEYKSKGVHFQCQSPLFVTTKLAKIRRASISTPTPATYAKSAVAHIGYETLVSPYWCHALMLAIGRSLPAPVLDFGLMQMHLPIRKAGMRKAAKAAAKKE
jgi:17beta-estradiol 17-dehydrogenase / very-long-chain 3-oxoacyl-CoA reductase